MGNIIQDIIPFRINTKGIKYSRITLTKDIQDLYIENCHTLLNNLKNPKKKNEDIYNVHGWKD